MLNPPCELGPLGTKLELFDISESSNSIFITSKVYGLLGGYSLCSVAHPTGLRPGVLGWVGYIYTGVDAMLRIALTPAYKKEKPAMRV